jgi:3',5'-cyclic-AMP phosphodiesterase
MQLVQLSDIHVGSFFKQQAFDTVVEEVNKLNPDAIIITGDLTDEGLLFQFEYARKQIKKFTCSNLIVLAGNHDYRHTGFCSRPLYYIVLMNLVIVLVVVIWALIS